MTSEKNYWPKGLLAFGIIVCICIVSMVFVAVNNGVEMDQSYMSNYKTVNKNYDQIASEKKIFEAKYNVKFDESNFALGQNTLKLAITDKNGTFFGNAKVVAVLTRPDTNSLNQTIENFTTKNNEYVSTPFTLDKKGRWIVEYKIDIDGISAFYKVERQIPIQ